MADEATNAALEALKGIEDGIDYIINKSQMFVDPAANTMRVHLFNARQIAVQMQGSVIPPASSEVVAGDAASGTTAAANVAGTGDQAQPTVQTGLPVPQTVPDQAPIVDGVPVVDQATWAGLPEAMRAALTTAAQDQASGQPLSPRQVALTDEAVPQGAGAPEDQAPAQTPPWAGQEGAPPA